MFQEVDRLNVPSGHRNGESATGATQSVESACPRNSRLFFARWALGQTFINDRITIVPQILQMYQVLSFCLTFAPNSCLAKAVYLQMLAFLHNVRYLHCSKLLVCRAFS